MNSPWSRRAPTSGRMAAIGLLGAVVAWADGQIDTVALLAAGWAAVQAIFIRAGITSEAQKAPP